MSDNSYGSIIVTVAKKMFIASLIAQTPTDNSGVQNDNNLLVADETVVCSLCGPGFLVGNPSGSVSIPGQPAVTCGMLASSLDITPIEAEACDQLNLFLDLTACGCLFVAADIGSTSPGPSLIDSPEASPSPSPSPNALPSSPSPNALSSSPSPNALPSSPSPRPTPSAAPFSTGNAMASKGSSKGGVASGPGASKGSSKAAGSVVGSKGSSKAAGSKKGSSKGGGSAAGASKGSSKAGGSAAGACKGSSKAGGSAAGASKGSSKAGGSAAGASKGSSKAGGSAAGVSKGSSKAGGSPAGASNGSSKAGNGSGPSVRTPDKKAKDESGKMKKRRQVRRK